MRVVMMTQAFLPEIGGIQVYAVEHAARMNEVYDWFAVMTPDRKGADEIDNALGYPVFRTKGSRRLRTLPWIWQLPMFLRGRQIDAVFNTQWPLATVSVMCRFLGLTKHVFVAIHGSELYVNPFRNKPVLEGLYEKWKRWVFKKADHFYPVSRYTASLLETQGVEKSRMTVVINGTNPDQFFPKDVTSLKKKLGFEGKKILISICRLDHIKGLDQVIQAMPDMIKKVPDLIYLVVGSGPDRERLERIAQEKGVVDRVFFLGEKSYLELNDYYNLGDLFVMPSRSKGRYEGFGIVYLEANAAGLPAVGSDTGGIPDAIERNVTGLLIPGDDVDTLGNEIAALFLDETRLKRMGQAGRERVLNEANWDVVGKQLVSDMKRRIGDV